MKKLLLFFFSILTVVLLYGAWPVSPCCFLIFFAFVPLLIIADKTTKRLSFFGYSFLSLLIFNAASTWWIWNSTDVGSIAAIIANSILMCLPWWGYHVMLKKYGRSIGYFSLICYWMLFEYIHLNWQLSWPWLSLGNVFAANPNWVQWYEYTGIAGGTLWILMVNIGCKILLKKLVGNRNAAFAFGFLWMIMIAAPLAISYILLSQKKEANLSKVNVLIVQPNVDPYAKFEVATSINEVQKLVSLSESNMDSTTQLIVWPETALSLATFQDQITKVDYYQPVFAFLQRHPKVTILSGIETYRNYGTYQATATCRQMQDGSYMDAFNSAIYIHANYPLQLYNKSKLVPGVESMPTFLNFMGPIFEKFGGTTGGYGKSDSSKVFSLSGYPYVPAPVICYESIYGEYVSTYVKRGANIITIITNDGWWGNTPGHKQHLQYARLRAIETRRWVARSANTGISAVIDDYGELKATQPWDKAAVIKYAIPTTNKLTFYVQYVDWLYKIASFVALLLLLWHSFLTMKGFFRRN